MGRTRFVGIKWDYWVMGESSARPSARMPLLQLMEVHRLFKCIRSRHERHNNRTKAPHPYDLCINLSGGRELGAQYKRWFQTTGPPTPMARSMPCSWAL